MNEFERSVIKREAQRLRRMELALTAIIGATEVGGLYENPALYAVAVEGLQLPQEQAREP